MGHTGDWLASRWSPEGRVSSRDRPGAERAWLATYSLGAVDRDLWTSVTHIFSKTEREHVSSLAGKYRCSFSSINMYRASYEASTWPARRLVKGKFFPPSQNSEVSNPLCRTLPRADVFIHLYRKDVLMRAVPSETLAVTRSSATVVLATTC